VTPFAGAGVDAPSTVLRVSGLVELHWRDWGGDSVVLEACSGQLFQFDPLSAALMACFEEGPRTAEEVAQALASDLAQGADGELHETVLAVVQEFRRLGWLEPIMAG
jgi:PqqD family protein of HPr-rel-A system